MANEYQTLDDFLFKPFGKSSNISKDMEYSSKYSQHVAKNEIKLVACCTVGDSFYFHITVPSDSSKGKMNYDVVIRFFTESNEFVGDPHLRNYKVQFFSNSPGFIYQYSYVYHKNGFLIKALYDKLDSEYIGVEPTKTNPNQVLGYDKSIYFACKFLSDNKFKYLTKSGVITMRMKPENDFFRSIGDFKSIKSDQLIVKEEEKLQKSLEKEKEKIKEKNTTTNKDKSIHSISIVKKIHSKPKIIGNRKITPKKK